MCTRAAAKESPDTQVWFMLVDQNFTHVSKGTWAVDVPSDGYVYHFIEKVEELHLTELEDVYTTRLIVWKLPTPQPAMEVMKKGCLTSIKPRDESSDEEVEMEGKGKAMQEVKASLLLPTDKLWLYLAEPAKERDIRVLVQFPARAEVADVLNHKSPTLRHLNVIIQRPASAPQNGYPSKRRRFDDYGDFSWLEEVHSKIWNNRELGSKLFRKVEVTQAHYTELKTRLDSQHPSRGTPEYDALENNVLNIKLDVLGLTFGEEAPSRHPDDNEDRVRNDDDNDPGESNEDIPGADDNGPEASNDHGVEIGDDDLEPSNESDAEFDYDHLEASNEHGDINSLFPFTLRFLDLSLLDLKKSVTDHLPLPLFLRQEYDDISVLIKEQPRRKEGSVVVSGQPGTGKTAYLHLMIIQSMIEGDPFLYQSSDGTVYYVNENCVEVIQTWSSTEKIVAFVDGDKFDHQPDYMLRHSSVQIVLTSPPEGADPHERWIRDIGCVTILATKLWSRHELLLTGIFLYRFDISVELLEESTGYFGYNPRLCFKAADSVRGLTWKKNDVMSRIRDVADEGCNTFQLVHLCQKGGSDVSHSIFVNFPRNKDRLFTQCKFGGVSKWALDQLLERYKIRRADVAAEFYKDISRAPETAPLWGHVFESLALSHLGDANPDLEFSIRRLASTEKQTWTYRRPLDRFNFRGESDFFDGITKAVRDQTLLHLVPISRNVKTVGSIIYDPNGALTCIQVTVRREHDILVKGLKLIQSWLKGPLDNLHPSRRMPWRFIFIVPSDEETFKSQRLIGDSARGVWAGKVHQYVLRLDVEKDVLRRG